MKATSALPLGLALAFGMACALAQEPACPPHPHYLAPAAGELLCGTAQEHGDLHGGRPDEAAARAVVTIPPETIQNMGVRTERAASARFGAGIRSYGLIAENARRTHAVSSRVAGWVETLEITAVGDRVGVGDLLFALYSPDLISAQQDYLAALAAGVEGRIRSSAERLRALGAGTKALEQIRAERRKLEPFPFHAEAGGVVRELMVHQGSYVRPGMQLAAIQDYRSVWVEASVAEKDLQFLSQGGKATVTFPNLGSLERAARIDYIHPTIDLDSRTGQVRLVLGNADGLLKPGAYADVLFETAIEKRLSIPSEAILKSSTGSFVVVALGGGRFQSRQIRTGIRHQGRTEVVRGLEDGDEVVVSSQFLIDSESALRESFRKLQQAQMPLALLEVGAMQQAALDHLIDAALYLHDAQTAPFEVEPGMLAFALQLARRLQPAFQGTKLHFVLQDAEQALAAAQQAMTQAEAQEALAALAAALRPWIVDGRPQHYKAQGLQLYLDHGTGQYWLQTEGGARHPYGAGHAVPVPLPDAPADAEMPPVEAPAGGGHAHH